MTCGVEGVGIYWCVVEMLYEEGGYLLLSEYERISFELRVEYERIEKVLNSSLFERDKDRFWSESVLKRLQARKEKSTKARESVEKRWKDTNVLRPNNDSNTIKESKIKESKEKDIVDNGTWVMEKKLFLNAEQWQMKQCSFFSISKEVLLSSLTTFLERLENQEDYKSEKELKRHFPNWFEKNRNKINGNGSLVSPSEQERLDKLNSFKPIRE